MTDVNKKLIGTALAVVLVIVAVLANHGDLGLPEFVAFLAGTGALGIISSLAVAALRIAMPAIANDYAVFFSMIVAVAVNAIAKALVPYVDNFPSALYEMWPTFIWVAQQAWYYLNPDSGSNRRARMASKIYYNEL